MSYMPTQLFIQQAHTCSPLAFADNYRDIMYLQHSKSTNRTYLARLPHIN